MSLKKYNNGDKGVAIVTYTDQMKNRIAESDYGAAFVVSDFIDIMEYFPSQPAFKVYSAESIK